MKPNQQILRRSWLFSAVAAVAQAGTRQIETFRKENVLGTSLEFQVIGAGAKAFDACLAEVERLRAILSTYDKSSALSQWQLRGETGPVPVEISELLDRYAHWQDRSGGAISSSISQKLNVNALGKSFIVERAIDAALKAAPEAGGILLNIGGDIAVRGGAWRIGVANPLRWHENAAPLDEFELRSGAVTTSGGYERGASHLIDPRTGKTASGALSATVLAADSVTANALSTALCVLDEQAGRRLVQSTERAACLVLRLDGTTWQSGGFKPAFKTVAAAAWPKNQQVTITLTLKAIEGYRVRRPYVAVWAEDLSGKLVRNITVWTEKRRWLPDLFEWWKKSGSAGGGSSVTRATRPPGRYQLLWDGLDDAGQPLPAGKYRIVVESNREHGSYAKESGVIECGANPSKVMLKENGEFEAVELSYGPGGQSA
jgi:thiamine biosynthesis lipoprotein ApbE